MTKIGVLALQGSVIEHINSLGRIHGVEPLEVRTMGDLNQVSGLILPGGESTTIGKLLREFKLLEPIKKRAQEGMPLWGTCAGMILMAKEIVNEEYAHLRLMDISVMRNAYGSQLDSFCSKAYIPQISEEEIPTVFIRAPWIEKAGNGVEVLSVVNENIVAARQKNMLVTSFHPELTNNLKVHQYFASMVWEQNINLQNN
jgi:5'-phosphate synthase pdxT subunit